jgi:M-phase inducer tyrosine phosphatase
MSLKVPPLTKQHTAPSLSRSREDDDIDTDLEASFRSSMSLYPVTPAPVQHAPRQISLASPIPMDISPAPAVAFNARPRSFGRELVNTVTNEILARNLLKATPDKPISKLSTVKSGTTSNKARQRAGLPTQWMQPSTPASVDMANASSLGSPMDVDSPAPRQPSPRPKRSYEQLDPIPNPRKRRSTEPEQTAPPPPQPPAFTLELDPPSSSPSVPKHHRKFDRFASSGLVLPLAATNSGVDNNNERKSRRPALATLSNPPQSAYPILEQPGEEPKEVRFSAALPPPRRAFSAVQPTFLAPFGAGDFSLSSDESFGQSSPAAAYAKRTNQRVLRRKDGTEEFRPKSTPSPAQGGSSPVPCAMPPFGAEAQGKILPCTSVREDGLMRINSHTVSLYASPRIVTV